MSKITAVDWLYERFLFAGYAAPSEWKEKALEMHKAEIADAYSSGKHKQMSKGEAEDYYKEVFNTKL